MTVAISEGLLNLYLYRFPLLAPLLHSKSRSKFLQVLNEMARHVPLRKGFRQSAPASVDAPCHELPSVADGASQEVSQPEGHPKPCQASPSLTDAENPGGDNQDSLHSQLGPWATIQDANGITKRSAFQSERWSEPWSLSQSCTETGPSHGGAAFSTTRDPSSLHACVSAVQSQLALLEWRMSHIEDQLEAFERLQSSPCVAGSTQRPSGKHSNLPPKNPEQQESMADDSSGAASVASLVSDLRKIEARVDGVAESENALKHAVASLSASVADLLLCPTSAQSLSRSRSCTHSSSHLEDEMLGKRHLQSIGTSIAHAGLDSNTAVSLRSTFGAPAVPSCELAGNPKDRNKGEGMSRVHTKASQSAIHGTQSNVTELMEPATRAAGQHTEATHAYSSSSGLDAPHTKANPSTSEAQTSKSSDQSLCLHAAMGSCERPPNVCLAPAISNEAVDTAHGFHSLTEGSCTGSALNTKLQSVGSRPSSSSLASSPCIEERCNEKNPAGATSPFSNTLLLIEEPGGERIYSAKVWLGCGTEAQTGYQIKLTVFGSLGKTSEIELCSSKPDVLDGAAQGAVCWRGCAQTCSIGRITGVHLCVLVVFRLVMLFTA
jgi:hypothetical protein